VTGYDGGTFLVSINGSTPYQISYGQNSTPQSLAANLAGDISCSYGPVQAVASGATVYLTSCSTNPADSYTLSASLDGNSSSFPSPSFNVISSGAKMVQAAESPASPNEPLSVISFFGSGQSGNSGAFTIVFDNASTGALATIATVTWSATSTPQTLAANLVSALKSCSSGGIIAAVQNGASVNLTSCAQGTSYVETVNIDYGGPGTPSFSAEADAYLVTESGTYDSGTATLSINGSQVASTTYGTTSTPFSIVAGLVSSSTNNTLVVLAPASTNPSYLTITAKQASEDSYAYSMSFTHSGSFSQPSFTASAPTGQLEGGQNAPLYNWAISSYAPNGDVLAMTDSVMGSWTYVYDDMNRLTSGAATSGPESGINLAWTYDRYGNRWSQSASGGGSAVQTSFSFTGNNNRIDQYINNYDQDGNLLKDANSSYTYDAENRIATVNGAENYIYDADGARVAKLSAGSISAVYILGAGGQQISEVDPGTGWAHSNVYSGAGRLLATYTPGTSTYSYNLTDWLGTKRMQTNAAGNQGEVCTSLPFGDSLNCTGGADATEQHFTGKERDAESGLDYFGARYLESSFGRFVTPDWAAAPISIPYARFGNPQSLNLYAYLENNPNAGVDVDGHYGNFDVGNTPPSYVVGVGSGYALNTDFLVAPPTPAQQVELDNEYDEQLKENLAQQQSAAPAPAKQQGHFEYDQKTGQMTHVLPDGKRVVVGTGYSGQGTGLNNPSEQYTPNSGPIPQGTYTIESQRDNVTGAGHKLPGSMRLDPTSDTDTHGRAGFLIHGDNQRGDHSASNGCIILPRPARNDIGGSSDHTLVVVP
jgi:RHS repeat-associated protein